MVGSFTKRPQRSLCVFYADMVGYLSYEGPLGVCAMTNEVSTPDVMIKHFICEPDRCEIHYYDTESLWLDDMNNFDFSGYCDDVWSDEVNHVFAGKLPDVAKCSQDDDDFMYDFLEQFMTHVATKRTIELRPDDVDEDGYSQSSSHWWGDDVSEICDYSFEPVLKETEK